MSDSVQQSTSNIDWNTYEPLVYYAIFKSYRHVFDSDEIKIIATIALEYLPVMTEGSEEFRALQLFLGEQRAAQARVEAAIKFAIDQYYHQDKKMINE